VGEKDKVAKPFKSMMNNLIFPSWGTEMVFIYICL